MARNIRVTLEYDGTEFRGWQVQPDERTVQGSLESCLRRLFGVPTRVTGSGRTDAGVHALGQVANFATTSTLDPERILRALNALLPPDVVVREAAEVPEDFHSRRDATRRRYVYRICERPRAVGRSYAWWIRTGLDTGAMEDASRGLVGAHDFASFCVAASEKDHCRCEVFHCAWHRGSGELSFVIEANRFVRAMVRSVVGTLVQVGRGVRAPGDIPALLAAGDRRLAGPTAPPHGLFLDQVLYGTQTASLTRSGQWLCARC